MQSITSFALYGFPESHAISFAILAYGERVSESASRAGILRQSAQQSADGILFAGDDRERCEPAWNEDAAGLRACDRTGIARLFPMIRCDWDFVW